MDKLELHIIDCPVQSYKLTGKGITDYYERALDRANGFYLELYEEAYKALMFRDFNVLWTPDTHSTNDIDPKDGFWAMGYFFFNVELIRILSGKYNIEVFDKTESDFRNQQELFAFLDNQGIQYSINQKKLQSKSFKNSLKKSVLGFFRNLIKHAKGSVQFLKEEFLESSTVPAAELKTNSDKEIVYLTIPPIGEMSVKAYLQWRYSSLFKQLKYHEKKGNQVVLVSTKDFKDSDDFDYPFINTFQLLTLRETFSIAFKSFYLKVKTLSYVWRERIKPDTSPLKRYFLKNIPTKLYFAIKENEVFDKLFKTHGRGLLIMKGPIVYKGACIHIHNARKHGVRVLSIAGRILTSNRLTNNFLGVHKDADYPIVLPHSMMLSDRISTESIKKQSNTIDIYTEEIIREKLHQNGLVRNLFTITLALQKKKEMENMVDAVVSVLQDWEDVELHLKMHPDFEMPEDLKERYSEIPFVKILPIDISLNDTVEMSDLCITAYSTSAFEFAKKMKPIVWINYVTLNSLFFTDVHKKIGFIAHNEEGLKKVLQRMKSDGKFYNDQKKNHYAQLKELIYETDDDVNHSFNMIIDKELEKI